MRCWMLLSAALAVNLHGAEVYEFKVPPKGDSVVAAEPVVVGEPVFEKSIIRQAKAAVQAGLIYAPEAVRFRNVQSIYGEGGLEYVCGEFNPVSEQGDYIGFVRFSFRANKLVIADQDAMLSNYPGNPLSGFIRISDAQQQNLDCR